MPRSTTITLNLLAAVLLSSASASAETAKEHYRTLISTAVYSAESRYLQTGWVDFNAGSSPEDAKMSGSNFVGSYYFGEAGDRWRPFVLGGFGFDKITQDRLGIGSGGAVKLNSTYLQLGGGINYNPTENLSLSLGASSLWLDTDAEYAGSDSDLKKYFAHDSDTTLYDLFATALFHTEIEGYKPYISATVHYLKIDYDFDLSDTDGFGSDLEIGTYTPLLAAWWGLPVRARLFAAGSLLFGDLSDTIPLDGTYSAGASLLWKIGPKIHLFNDAFKDAELAFNLQATTGESSLRGWKASVSCSISKF
ncbi:OmpA family protein [Nitratifractor sp.]